VTTQAKQVLDTVKNQVIDEAKGKLQEILTGQKDTTQKGKVIDNVKNTLKDKIKFPW
jgi:hypothetical protein